MTSGTTSMPVLQERHDGFSYGYRMHCECGGASCISAADYHTQSHIDALMACDHCDRLIHFGPAVAALRDEHDPALDNTRISTLAWYHTSASPNWPSPGYAEEQKAKLLTVEDRFPGDVYDVLAHRPPQARHVGTYEAAIENMLRRMCDQSDAATRFYLHRIWLTVHPDRVNNGYRDENHEPAAQLTATDGTAPPAPPGQHRLHHTPARPVDAARAGTVHSGERLLFGVSGSGLTTGTAVYDLDDLPDRIRGHAPIAPSQPNRTRLAPPTRRTRERPVSLAGCWAALAHVNAFDSAGAAASATDNALRHAGIDAAQVDWLIHAGVYRTDFVYEPAMAASVAAQLHSPLLQRAGPAGPLCSDIGDGALGFLRAMQAAHAALASGRAQVAVIATSEVDVNAHAGAPPLGIATGAGAVVLTADDEPPAGRGEFAEFAFATAPTPLQWRHAGAMPNTPVTVRLDGDPRVEEAYVAALLEAVKRLGYLPTDARWVLSPFVASPLSERCRIALGIAPERWWHTDTGTADDGVTLTLPLALSELDGRTGPGDDVLLAAGAGVAAGCALYRY